MVFRFSKSVQSCCPHPIDMQHVVFILYSFSIRLGKERVLFFHEWIIHFIPLQQVKHIDKNILTLLAATIVSSSNLFVYCYYGKVASESYQRMADCLYSDSIWWEFPVEIQKYMLLMNVNMQRLLYYHGFEVAVLNLETFTTVRKYAREQSITYLQRITPFIFNFS